MTKPKIYYHFTGKKLRDGRDVPKVGEWLKHDGEIKMCEQGLHASAHPFDALSYAPGEFLHKVQLGGKIITGDAAWDAQRKLFAEKVEKEFQKAGAL
jgi:hypothetical protein